MPVSSEECIRLEVLPFGFYTDVSVRINVGLTSIFSEQDLVMAYDGAPIRTE